MDVREQYLKNQITGSSKEQLLVMLLEGGERFIRVAQLDLAKKNLEGVHNNLTKAENIYLELFCALDPEAGDFVPNLQGLYYLMYNNLLEANIKKDGVLLGNCLKVAQDLTGMWKETIDKYKTENSESIYRGQQVRNIDIRG